MSRIAALLDDIRVLVPLASVGSEDPTYQMYQRLIQLVDSVIDTPELDELSPEELRDFRTFRITLYRSSKMTPDKRHQHVGAAWRGAAKQAIMKMSIGPEAQKCVHELTAAGIG